MTQYFFNVESMDLLINKQLIRHIYRASIQDMEGPILEGHPLMMICDALCHRYDVEAIVEVDHDRAYIAVDMKQHAIEETFRIKHKLKYMTETLLKAKITEVY